MGKKLYDVLGISDDASLSEIKKAYRKRALQYHPDRHLSDPIKQKECEEIFKMMSNAYEILSDPHKRQAYDNGRIDEFGNVNYSHTYFDAEEIKLKAAKVNNGWELQALMLTTLDSKLHQLILKHVDFAKIINNSSNDLKIALAYLEKAENHLFRFHSILINVNESKRKQIYDLIIAEKLILNDLQTFKDFLSVIKNDKLFHEVINALVLEIVQDNAELAFTIQHLSEEKQRKIIQMVAIQTFEREPIINIFAAAWNMQKVECLNELQFKFVLSLFGFDPDLKQDILKISKKAKFEFYDDAGMVVNFYSKTKPTLKEIIELQEKEDDLKNRSRADCISQYLSNNSDEFNKKHDLFQQKVENLISKYKTNSHAAFFKRPDERGMAYSGKPMLLNILKGRSYK
jgi:curved DNA-binding protein CbpA